MKELFNKSKFAFLFIVSCFAFLASCVECVLLTFEEHIHGAIFPVLSLGMVGLFIGLVIYSLCKKKTKFNLLILVFILSWVISLAFAEIVLLSNIDTGTFIRDSEFIFPCVYRMVETSKTTNILLREWIRGVYLNWLVSLVMVIVTGSLIFMERRKNKE